MSSSTRTWSTLQPPTDGSTHGSGPSARPWHAETGAVTALESGVDPTHGLTTQEAWRRLAAHGPNTMVPERRGTALRRLGSQFGDVLIWLLIIAALASGFLLDAWVDAAAIAAIVVLNASIGFAQESRAAGALAKLKEMEAPEATVIRDSQRARVATADVVLGDVLLLGSGDVIPADARLFEAIHLVTNEAPLTGESMPVTKTSDSVPANASLPDRRSMVYAGTSVVAGRGRAVVTDTGAGTQMGQIATLMTEEGPATPLQVELARVGWRLAVVAAVAAVFIFGAGLLRSHPIETMALTAVALAVAAIPEGLPAVVSVTLSGGLQRMAHRNAIVRRLPAVEALGAVDVICTDKTGTLTAPELEVAELVLPDGRRGLGLLEDDGGWSRWLGAVAYLCNDAHETTAGWKGDPTEVALKKAVERWSSVRLKEMEASYHRLDEVGFDSRRKRMSTVHQGQDGTVLLCKGAPEILAERADEVWDRDGRRPMGRDNREAILQTAEHLAANGMRTIAAAVRFEVPDEYSDTSELERQLTFLGVFGLTERIRPEVPKALAAAAEAGVRTVMVTGDHVTTAKAVADAIGIDRLGVMEGKTLAATSISELAKSIEDYSVFARVDPTDKVKIVRAWQSRGALVAMTGDGVNDAPALGHADIGVAMGSGTEVARESAGIVLTDDNYATIVSAISEGRRLFSNLRNVVHYLLSANASEVMYVLIGFLAFSSTGIPLTAVQLLWINLISDSLPAVALGMDRPTHDLMKDPPGQGREILSRRNIMRLLIQGLILASGAVCTLVLGTYVLALDPTTVRTMVFTTLVVSQLLHALNVRAPSASSAPAGTTGRPGTMMIAAMAGSMIVHLGAVYTSFGNQLIGTASLGPIAAVVALAGATATAIVIRVLGLAGQNG